MNITEALKSGKLTKKGALRLIESLLEGETQIDVNDGSVLYCYGQAPQSYATFEAVTGYEAVEDFASDLNDGYCCVNDQPYENMKLLFDILGLDIKEVAGDGQGNSTI